MGIKLFITSFLLFVFNLGCAREGNPYARVQDGFFQVASKSFLPANGSGPKITLLGAIHIGEASYYRQIQERLDKADVVLYEGIGIRSEKKEVKKTCPQFLSKGGGHADAAKRLNLVCQKEHIKKGRHFVHADISLNTLLDLNKVAMGQPLCARISKQQGKKDDQPNNRDSNTMRNETAMQLLKSLGHERENASEEEIIILFKRNEFALKTLKAELPKFGAGQEMILFYGAAHMPDIEKSLNDMDYRPDSSEWLSVFSL